MIISSGVKSKKKNIFTSKADVLSFLNSNLKNSKIEKIYSFVVDDWKKNREEILQQIELTFNKKKVIIRVEDKQIFHCFLFYVLNFHQ